MNTMAEVFISLFIAAIHIGLIIAQGDPTAKLIFTKVDSKVNDNPYVDGWFGEILPPGERISFKVPVKKEIPPTLMMKGDIKFMGNKFGAIDMTLCEAFKDELFAKSVLEAGIPKGQFPTGCPINANADYVISEYLFPPYKIPPGLPDGPVVVDVQFYEPGNDPYVIIHADLELTHTIPGLGR